MSPLFVLVKRCDRELKVTNHVIIGWASCHASGISWWPETSIQSSRALSERDGYHTCPSQPRAALRYAAGFCCCSYYLLPRLAAASCLPALELFCCVLLWWHVSETWFCWRLRCLTDISLFAMGFNSCVNGTLRTTLKVIADALVSFAVNPPKGCCISFANPHY